MRHAVEHLIDIDPQTLDGRSRPGECHQRVLHILPETGVVGGFDDDPQFTHACEVEAGEDGCPVPFEAALRVALYGTRVSAVGPKGVLGDFEDDGVGVEELQGFPTKLAVHAADAGEIAADGRA